MDNIDIDKLTGDDLEALLLDENVTMDDLDDLVEKPFDVAEDFQNYAKGYLEKRGKVYPEGGLPNSSPLFAHIYQAYQIEVLSKKKKWNLWEPLPEPEYKAPPKMDMKEIIKKEQEKLDMLKQQGLM